VRKRRCDRKRWRKFTRLSGFPAGAKNVSTNDREAAGLVRFAAALLGCAVIVFFCDACGKQLNDFVPLRSVVTWFEKRR